MYAMICTSPLHDLWYRLMHITYRYPPQQAITFIVVSFFLAIFLYILFKHYAESTCILHCALFNNCYTRLPSHQLQLHKRRKKLRISLPLFVYIMVFWPFETFPNGISWISWKGSVKQETWLTSVVWHYPTLCFRKRRWRNLWNQSKIPLNTLKDQMNLNRFIIIHKK